MGTPSRGWSGAEEYLPKGSAEVVSRYQAHSEMHVRLINMFISYHIISYHIIYIYIYIYIYIFIFIYTLKQHLRSN